MLICLLGDVLFILCSLSLAWSFARTSRTSFFTYYFITDAWNFQCQIWYYDRIVSHSYFSCVVIRKFNYEIYVRRWIEENKIANKQQVKNYIQLQILFAQHNKLIKKRKREKTKLVRQSFQVPQETHTNHYWKWTAKYGYLSIKMRI